MDSVYIEAGTPLYKGFGPYNSSGFNVSRNYRSRLFWLTKNAVSAASYAKTGRVVVYRPLRRLRLLKLTYRTVEKLYNSLVANNNKTNNDKKLIKLLESGWGVSSNTFLTQFFGKTANNGMPLSMRMNILSRIRHLMQERVPLKEVKELWMQPNGTPKRAGRVSVISHNIQMYNLIRNKFARTNGGPLQVYDGLWSPAVRSPFHNKFKSEMVIFNPSEVLGKENLSPENLQNILKQNNIRKQAQLNLKRQRELKKGPNSA
jgi:hypothetical protein